MIKDLLDSFAGKRVMVVGDVMLDHYVWGNVERISPEAPVPVIEVQNEEYRLGGAANVALNLSSLGAEAVLIGVTGKDTATNRLHQLLEEQGIDPGFLVTDPSRSTTLKTRIAAANQQIVRIDYETKTDVDKLVAEELIVRIRQSLNDCSALVIEDYNKGVLAQPVITATLELAFRQGIPVAVDPKQRHFFSYLGVDIFKPNYKDMQTNLGQVFEDEAAFIKAAENLRRQMRIKYLVITRGSLGLYIFDGSDAPKLLPTYAREVFDVSGAGDTVISALTLAYASGADIHLAAEIANHAAGVVCGIKGTASVSSQQILDSYREQG